MPPVLLLRLDKAGAIELPPERTSNACNNIDRNLSALRHTGQMSADRLSSVLLERCKLMDLGVGD